MRIGHQVGGGKSNAHPKQWPFVLRRSFFSNLAQNVRLLFDQKASLSKSISYAISVRVCVEEPAVLRRREFLMQSARSLFTTRQQQLSTASSLPEESQWVKCIRWQTSRNMPLRIARAVFFLRANQSLPFAIGLYRVFHRSLNSDNLDFRVWPHRTAVALQPHWAPTNQWLRRQTSGQSTSDPSITPLYY